MRLRLQSHSTNLTGSWLPSSAAAPALATRWRGASPDGEEHLTAGFISVTHQSSVRFDSPGSSLSPSSPVAAPGTVSGQMLSGIWADALGRRWLPGVFRGAEVQEDASLGCRQPGTKAAQRALGAAQHPPPGPPLGLHPAWLHGKHCPAQRLPLVSRKESAVMGAGSRARDGDQGPQGIDTGVGCSRWGVLCCGQPPEQCWGTLSSRVRNQHGQ